MVAKYFHSFKIFILIIHLSNTPFNHIKKKKPTHSLKHYKNTNLHILKNPKHTLKLIKSFKLLHTNNFNYTSITILITLQEDKYT